MNAFDYYKNPKILSYISEVMSHIKNREDREDCQQEIFAELYDFMPIEEEESRNLIKRVAMKFVRNTNRIAEHEVSFDEAGLDD